MAKVSIIVPVYNVEKHLKPCVNSLLNQTFNDIEIILVNDGSTDNCGALCDSFAEKDSRVKVLHQENLGVSAARNNGVKAASGEYVSFVDSDDLVYGDYVAYLLNLLKNNPDCEFSACGHLVVRGEKKTPNSTFTGVRVLNRKEAFFEVLYHGILDISPWGKLYKKEIFNTVSFPLGIRYEDTYAFGDILSVCQKVVFGGDYKYEYIQHENSFVGSGFSPVRLSYIPAAEHLCEMALICDSSLKTACVRRRTHAVLSTLRYMEKCPAEYKKTRKELKRDVLKNAKLLLLDKHTPKRDKIAILSLMFGLPVFFACWKIYGKVR
jgi:glycosyltransferase involved in cell wall biosynthesis